MDLSDIKVSIIITSYNYEEFIREAIDSVLQQSYSNKELIVVDDCSKDSSKSIIVSYGNKLISVLKNVNQGHGAAFNSGLENSTGDLVLFLDADDYLLAGSLQQVVNNYCKDVSLYQYRMTLVDQSGSAYGVFPIMSQAWNSAQARENILRYGRYQTTVTSGMVYRREFLEKVMPMDLECFRQGADGYLATLAPLYGLVKGFDYLLSGYRQHGGNHSGFSNDLLKQAYWGVEHNIARYKNLKLHAEKNGLKDKIRYEDTDIYHLQSRMCIALFEPAEQENRCRLFYKVLVALHMFKGFKVKFIMTLWWISLLLPRVISKKTYMWKVIPSSRPWRAKQ
ncbi:MAG: glycosyltransferase [Oceanospirillaceae bacterium]|nr:glycosyltransferase [Oceanospirillaceae bacterium]